MTAPVRTPSSASTGLDDQPNPVVELIDSTDLLGDAAALHARADRDGYLFFRGLLDRGRVLGLRRQLMEVVADHGWLVAGTDPDDGIADRAAFDRVPAAEAAFCGTGIPIEAYRDVYRTEELHAIGHDPALIGLYETLLGGPVLRQPLSIARVMVPGSAFTPTPPHQDFIHIQGTTDVWTAWFPLGDCPVELGGLRVLVGSHADGLLTYHAAAGAGELEAYICDSGLAWGTTDYRAGDVLTFGSLTVHGGMPNQARERVRLSLDLRYQSPGGTITEPTLLPHCQILDWDQVYAGWSGTAPQYYWREHDLHVIPHSRELQWQQHKIC